MRDRLNSDECSKFLKALADPERLRIVQCLQAGPLTVGEICRRLESPLQNVSHHLKQLRISGVLTGRKDGRFVIYELSEAVRAKSNQPGSRLEVLDFGCCRLELGKR